MSIEREYEIVLQLEPEGGFSVFVSQLPSVATRARQSRKPARWLGAIESYLHVRHENSLPIATSTAVAALSMPREC